MKCLRQALRLWLIDVGMITTCCVMGVAMGAAAGCTFGALYFMAKLFVVIAERMFG